jgi:hypothetical protein
MPHGAHVLSLLEDALAEAFQYHNALDNFLRRSGVSDARLTAARRTAEERSNVSSSNFDRAPKRFVVQALLAGLDRGTDEEDRVVADLVTALCKGRFPDASPNATAAIRALVEERASEREEAGAQREERWRKKREDERARENAAAKEAGTREGFKASFLHLCQESDPQARGYMLEQFLNKFLAFELIGEQIDGSFAWSGRTYLVEAKWVSTPVGGAGFSGLMYKIEGKTADTRGLFISINGYSQDAINGLKQKGELRFVCIDGAHLMRCLEHGGSFRRLLEMIWRHADETGEAYLPVGLPAFAARNT